MRLSEVTYKDLIALVEAYDYGEIIAIGYADELQEKLGDIEVVDTHVGRNGYAYYTEKDKFDFRKII